MTTFLDTPRTRSEHRPAHHHDPGCTRPGWAIQPRILDHGPLLAHCLGCTAVTTTEGNPR